jgi:glycosyltransferase involved in cell wall biosynthesis
VGNFDILMVGYPGQFDVFLARLLAWLRRKPLVWDVFMSIYLIALERGLEGRGRLAMALMRRAEALALRLPDRLIQDTASYVNWLCDTHRVTAERFRLVPTGADDRVFKPFQAEAPEPGGFRVIYYGTFIPNHGVGHIVEAARLLAGEGVLFELVGSGPEQARARQLAEAYALPHVTFSEWLERPALMQRVRQAQVVLGAFGTTPQSLMTVQNKIYEGLAMGKAVISGDSEAVRQVLQHGEHIYLCERASGAALAEAIRALREDPGLRARLSEQGYRLFQEQFCLQMNGQRFATHLQELIRK